MNERRAPAESTFGPQYEGKAGRTRTESLHVRTAGGALHAVEVYRVVNVRTHPALRADVLQGRLNRLPDRSEIAVPFVYHDPAAFKFALVVPRSLAHLELRERAQLMTELAEDREHLVPAYVREGVTVLGVEELARYLGLAASSPAGAAPPQGQQNAPPPARSPVTVGNSGGGLLAHLVPRLLTAQDKPAARTVSRTESASVAARRLLFQTGGRDAAPDEDDDVDDVETPDESAAACFSRLRPEVGATPAEPKSGPAARDRPAEALNADGSTSKEPPPQNIRLPQAEAPARLGPPPLPPEALKPRPAVGPPPAPTAPTPSPASMVRVATGNPSQAEPPARHAASVGAVRAAPSRTLSTTGGVPACGAPTTSAAIPSGESAVTAASAAVAPDLAAVNGPGAAADSAWQTALASDSQSGVRSAPKPASAGARFPRVATALRASSPTAPAQDLPRAEPVPSARVEPRRSATSAMPARATPELSDSLSGDPEEAPSLGRMALRRMGDALRLFVAAPAGRADAYDDEAELLVQLGDVDARPLVIIALEGAGGSVARWVDDGLSPSTHAVLERLGRDFRAELVVFVDGVAGAPRPVFAPREQNAKAIAAHLACIRVRPALTAADAIARCYAKPPALRDPGLPFGSAKLPPPSPSTVLGALVQLEAWYEPQRLDDALLRYSVPKHVIDAWFRRVLRSAHAFGIAIPQGLAGLLLEQQLAPSPAEFVRQQIVAFRSRVERGQNDLDAAQTQRNWELLLAEADALGLAFDPGQRSLPGVGSVRIAAL